MCCLSKINQHLPLTQVAGDRFNLFEGVLDYITSDVICQYLPTTIGPSGFSNFDSCDLFEGGLQQIS